MVSWIVYSVAICALASVGYSFPVVEEHQEIGIPETIVGHEEILGHQIGLSQELPELKPKHATSYQSFHLEGKHAVPIVIKTVHPPTLKHISSIGESFGHEISHEVHHEIPHEISHEISHEIPHEIPHEVEPIDLKVHEI